MLDAQDIVLNPGMIRISATEEGGHALGFNKYGIYITSRKSDEERSTTVPELITGKRTRGQVGLSFDAICCLSFDML